jgi:AbiV family abortive infection protein
LVRAGAGLRCSLAARMSLPSVVDEGCVMVAKRLPDEKEAIEGAVVSLANAARLLGDADLLAGAGSTGTAVSIVVLAFEEAVKARTLGAIAAAAAVGTQPGFTEDGLRKIVYSGHQTRHAAGFLQHLAAASPGIYGNLILGIPLPPDAINEVRELVEVVSSANDSKQAGFYTDFDSASGSWSAPGIVSDAVFGKMRAIIAAFINETQRQLDDFRRSAGQTSPYSANDRLRNGRSAPGRPKVTSQGFWRSL